MYRSARQINHPGRKPILQCIDCNCTAATPPSKGGETYTIIFCHKAILRLIAMSPAAFKVGFRNNSNR